MSENFAELIENNLKSIEAKPGAMLLAKVIDIDHGVVTVSAGLKSEGLIPVAQFKDKEGALEVQVGDDVSVVLDTIENGMGATMFSREKAKRIETWLELESIKENGDLIQGKIIARVKGGFAVETDYIRAFLPGSLVDIRPVSEDMEFEGQTFDFKIIKLDEKRNNIVVSRKAVLELDNVEERQALLASLKEGAVISGIVKNLADYGAFIDLGGIDGLLHITDISWKRIKHPGDVLAVGDKVDLKILKFDEETGRVSLGLKQLTNDPWQDIELRYETGKQYKTKVTNLTDYGCFAELEPGIEGLIHVSEMDWTNKNIRPAKMVAVGEEVNVVLLDLDTRTRRISLGMKQCQANPWEEFADKHKRDDRVHGCIKSITDFGIFVGLDGNIDGLIHISDLSWDMPGEQAIRQYKKDDTIEVVVLGVDVARERISLGVKQLQNDAFNDYIAVHPKNSLVTGTVKQLDAKVAEINLAESVTAILKVQDASVAPVKDLHEIMQEGDSVEAKIVNIDKKSRQIQLSIKAKSLEEDKQVMRQVNRQSNTAKITTIGDLIKEQMEE